MSDQVRSRTQSKERKDDGGSKKHVGAQQPKDEKRKQTDAPPENQDIKPDQVKEVEGAPVAQGGDLQVGLQKLPQAKAEPVTGYPREVKGRTPPFLEPIKWPKAGEGQPHV